MNLEKVSSSEDNPYSNTLLKHNVHINMWNILTNIKIDFMIITSRFIIGVIYSVSKN